eukprot:13670845-Heterocapsa_arctica.AAC.1
MEHNYAEKQAQVQCYEALIDEYHGTTKEKKEQGYKFNLVDSSRFGWVPHAAIYAWLKSMWTDSLTDR